MKDLLAEVLVDLLIAVLGVTAGSFVASLSSEECCHVETRR